MGMHQRIQIVFAGPLRPSLLTQQHAPQQKTDLDPCWISPKSVTDTFRLPVLACQLATVCGSGMTELQDLARIVETLSPSGIANFSSSLHEMGELRLERAHRRQINKSLRESVIHVCVAVQGLKIQFVIHSHVSEEGVQRLVVVDQSIFLGE